MTSPDGNTGRFLIALGGFLGFSGAFFSALRLGHGDVSSALLRASIGMIVGAMLMKLLLMVVYASVREARIEKQRALASRPKPDGAAPPDEPSSGGH